MTIRSNPLCSIEGFLDFVFKPDILGHSGGDILLHHLTGLPDRGLHLHTQDLIQIGIGIGIDGKDGAVPSVQEVTKNHSCQGRFPCSAFS